MLELIINLVSSGAVDSHTPHTADAAVLCAAMTGLFSYVSEC
ncbi:YshB family small membrane protein [Escherichia coli]|nr:YshB family small membrane protein [Escherichia coli]